jgi:molybdopterin synthase sulfur carrier subunit
VLLVRYFAGARAAAGRTEEKVEATTLADLVDTLNSAHGDRLARVLSASSFLVDGLVCHDRSARLAPDATVDVLPPFAGG